MRRDTSWDRISEEPFEAGQVWSYRCRPQDSNSRVTILRVDHDDRAGEIVHIAVNGLNIRNPGSPSGRCQSVGHLPYSSDALRGCLTQLEHIDCDLPDFEGGYGLWREAFERGKAGIFSIALSDVIETIERGCATPLRPDAKRSVN